MKNFLPICFAVATLFVAGCSSPSNPPASTLSAQNATTTNSDLSALQGTWTGREITSGHEGPVSLTITGQTLDYHGADDEDWAKGSFTLRDDVSPNEMIGTITQCADPQNIGRNIYSIYKIENGTLTITGGGADASSMPDKFDSRVARRFVFKRSQ